MLYVYNFDILFSIIFWNLFILLHVVLVYCSFLLHIISSYEYTNVSLHHFAIHLLLQMSILIFVSPILSLALYLTGYLYISLSHLRINLSKNYLDMMLLFPHLSLLCFSFSCFPIISPRQLLFNKQAMRKMTTS